MAWWKRFFKKKTEPVEEDDWEQLVYTRNGVNFEEEDQRKRYIVNCLEQIAEASREIDLLTGEYTLVTSYLTDMEEIEALPAQQRGEINRTAGKISALEQERSKYREKKNRMKDADYYAIRKREDEIEEGIRKIREGEKYGNLVRQDLHRLDGERHAYEYRRNELENLMNNQRGMAVIFLTALIVCVIMLAVLQFAFEMDTYVGYFLAVGAGAVAISYVCIKYMDSDRELQRVEKTINKLIQLQNKVKIRYVNNCQLMEYLYLKYNTDSAARLEKLWKMYQDERKNGNSSRRRKPRSNITRSNWWNSCLTIGYRCRNAGSVRRQLFWINAKWWKSDMNSFREDRRSANRWITTRRWRRPPGTK